ncbi:MULTISPECIES: hypothetical protein [Paracoccus]|jgi:hypothetical protein|uniref:hypothetical protein n=1 Tax=Paracoccus TaxID=265 RepID=UPI00031AE656|nr:MULTISPECIES: hypothetical protein [Paracoccus]MBB4625362.1 hypothetical protein [Paracoccus denitrificans]MCU7428188.1 hypothetical protein [Paracoccus denitrificans]MDK8873456.1 hypothetical protein [Paracoccus sp. SSJ]QAR26957.1 hypothetical protein EO213_11945 [Paracoccus denitrificans]UFS64300.1 hypothetical protein LO749_08975 [Paracoccus denitrificans]
MARKDHRSRPAGPGAEETGNRSISGGLLPAMPESPIPDWAPRNRTPDPLSRPAAQPEPCDAKG